jgi:hypothetical protein
MSQKRSKIRSIRISTKNNVVGGQGGLSGSSSPAHQGHTFLDQSSKRGGAGGTTPLGLTDWGVARARAAADARGESDRGAVGTVKELYDYRRWPPRPGPGEGVEGNSSPNLLLKRLHDIEKKIIDLEHNCSNTGDIDDSYPAHDPDSGSGSGSGSGSVSSILDPSSDLSDHFHGDSRLSSADLAKSDGPATPDGSATPGAGDGPSPAGSPAPAGGLTSRLWDTVRPPEVAAGPASRESEDK